MLETYQGFHRRLQHTRIAWLSDSCFRSRIKPGCFTMIHLFNLGERIQNSSFLPPHITITTFIEASVHTKHDRHLFTLHGQVITIRTLQHISLIHLTQRCNITNKVYKDASKLPFKYVFFSCRDNNSVFTDSGHISAIQPRPCPLMVTLSFDGGSSAGAKDSPAAAL